MHDDIFLEVMRKGTCLDAFESTDLIEAISTAALVAAVSALEM